jgi:hypothetical protein
VTELPPYVKAYADSLLAVAPPLSPAQKRLIQQIFAPVVRELAEQQAEADRGARS